MIDQVKKLADLLKKADENAEQKFITDYEDAILDNAEYLIANDVVPVVRCKDCIYNKGKSVEFNDIIFCHKELPKARKLYDFCSYGERKADNG